MPGIVFKNVGGKTVLQPDRPGAQPGDPYQADLGDLITWNNETNDIHHPVAIDPVTTYLTDEIPPGRVSSPIFNVEEAKTITYQCSRHPDNPDEKGTIEVS